MKVPFYKNCKFKVDKIWGKTYEYKMRKKLRNSNCNLLLHNDSWFFNGTLMWLWIFQINIYYLDYFITCKWTSKILQ